MNLILSQTPNQLLLILLSSVRGGGHCLCSPELYSAGFIFETSPLIMVKHRN
jgi:hypothetical protein